MRRGKVVARGLRFPGEGARIRGLQPEVSDHAERLLVGCSIRKGNERGSYHAGRLALLLDGIAPQRMPIAGIERLHDTIFGSSVDDVAGGRFWRQTGHLYSVVWDALFPELCAIAGSQHEHAIRAIDIELPIERDQRPKSVVARTLPERRAVRGAQRGYFTGVIHVENPIVKNRLIGAWARAAADGFTPELLAVTDAQRVQHLHSCACSLRAGHVHDAMLNERQDRRGKGVAAKIRRASGMPQ